MWKNSFLLNDVIVSLIQNRVQGLYFLIEILGYGKSNYDLNVIFCRAFHTKQCYLFYFSVVFLYLVKVQGISGQPNR